MGISIRTEKIINKVDSCIELINIYWEKGELIIPVVSIFLGIIYQFEILIFVVSGIALFLEIYNSKVGNYEKLLSQSSQKLITFLFALRTSFIFLGIQIFFNFVSTFITTLLNVVSNPFFLQFKDSVGDTIDISRVGNFEFPIIEFNQFDILIPIILLLDIFLILFPFERKVVNRIGEKFPKESSTSKQMKGIIADWVLLMSLFGDFFFLFSYLIYNLMRKIFKHQHFSAKSLSSYIIGKIEKFPLGQRSIAGMMSLLVLGGFILNPLSLDPMKFFIEDVLLSLEIFFWYFFLFICLIFSVNTEKHFLNYIFTSIVSMSIALRGIMIFFKDLSREALLYVPTPLTEFLVVIIIIIIIFFLCILVIASILACSARGLIELKMILTKNLKIGVFRKPLIYSAGIFVLGVIGLNFLFSSIKSLFIPAISSYYGQGSTIGPTISSFLLILDLGFLLFTIIGTIYYTYSIQEVSKGVSPLPDTNSCPKCKKMIEFLGSYCVYCGYRYK